MTRKKQNKNGEDFLADIICGTIGWFFGDNLSTGCTKAAKNSRYTLRKTRKRKSSWF